MPQKWEKVYVFISSTFNDMHAERDYLVKNVFPQLQDWCEKRKLRLVDIDLRWGVTEQDALYNKNVVKVCLDRIDECRPFFLCFLGQRRGWVPKENEISQETFESFPDLKPLVGLNSVTEIEILHALITPLHQSKKRDPKKPTEQYEKAKHAFFYLRDLSYLGHLPNDPALLRQTYTNEGIEDPKERAVNGQELQKWREVTIRDSGRPVHIYSAEWNHEAFTPELSIPLQCSSTEATNMDRWRVQWAKAGVVVSGTSIMDREDEVEKARRFNMKLCTGRLTDFECDDKPLSSAIIEDLKAAITARFPDHTEIRSYSDLEKEIDQQEQFLFLNSEGFIEREGDFSELDNYVNSDSNKLFVLTAPGGMGKSMFLANWIDRYRIRIEGIKEQSIHFRFIGASDKSTTVYSLLNFLLQEIKEVGHKLDELIPEDPKKLLEAWPKLLEATGKHGKTVIVIDALNQLESGLSEINWLPWLLPPNIKLIVSFKRGEQAAEELLERLEKSRQVLLAEVKPFEDLEDRRKLVRAYLSQYLKDLDKQHLEALIRLAGASNPLYLKVVLNELRVFGAFSNLEMKIRGDFGETPVSAFQGLLRRLETDPAYSPIDPKQAVPLLFGLMAHARHGLSAEELASLFVQALKLEDTKGQREVATDSVYLFLRQVRPFLARREGRYDFFYDSFKIAAEEGYVAKSPEQVLPKRLLSKDWHRMLEEYFGGLPTWQENVSKMDGTAGRMPTVRKVSELPYHQTYGQMWNELETTLTDLDFIEAKCASGMTLDLVHDYDVALDVLPEAELETQEKMRREVRVKKYTEDLIAYANKEIGHLDIIPSVEPWSKEKIWQDIERIVNNPTQLDRIRAFSQFVNSESHTLPKFASCLGFTVQQAYNSVRNGPVGLAAESIASAGTDRILLQHPTRQRPEYNPHPALIRTLQGHTSSIYCVSLTPDGKKAVSAGADRALRVWDIESGRCLKTMQGHTNNVLGVCLTPDGKIAVSASVDYTLRVWDTERGECLRTLETHPENASCVSLTPDGKRVISGSNNGNLRVWDVKNGECLRVLDGHLKSVDCVSLTPDGRKAISGSSDETLRVWDIESGRCLKTMQGGIDNCVCLTPDGKTAVSASHFDNTLKVWNIESGECVKTLHGHTDSVYSLSGIRNVSLTPDGKTAVSASHSDNTLKVWNIESGECVKTLHGHTDSVYCVSLTPDGRKAISGSSDETLRVWDIESGRCLKTMQGHTNGVECVCLAPDGKTAVSASHFSLMVWAVASGEYLKTLTGHTGHVVCVSLTPDGKRAISGSEDWTSKVWDLESGKCLKTLGGNRSDVRFVCFTPDGKTAISAAGDMRVWDIESGRCLKTMQGGAVQSVGVTPDGKTAVTAYGEVWDLESGERIKTLHDSANCVSLTPDGKRAVFASRDNALKVWDLESGKCIKTLHDSANCVSLTPDGKTAVTACADNTLKVWDIESGTCIKTLQGHVRGVFWVSLTPDGRRAISASQDNTLRVWNLENGECLAIYQAIIYANEQKSYPSSITPSGNFALGLTTGEVNFVASRNLVAEPPLVTPVRLWRRAQGWSDLFEDETMNARWDDKVTVACPWCAKRFTISEEKLDLITSINRNANLSPDQSPCWELPREVWREPRLISECSVCHKPLKLNPFIVDNSLNQEEKQSRPNTDSKQSQDEFNVEQLLDEGHSFRSQERFYDAVESFDKVLEINPQLAKIWTAKGNNLEGLGCHDEARICYDNAAEITKQSVEAWTGRGAALCGLGRFTEAMECFNKILEINPQHALAWFHKGGIEDEIGEKRNAAISYSRFINLSTAFDAKRVEIARKRLRQLQEAEALVSKGGILYNLGRYAEAIQYSDRALEINRKDADAWANKGLSLASLGQFDEAIQCYETALDWSPNDTWIWSNRGDSLYKLNLFDEAIQCYEKALEINQQRAETWLIKGIAEDRMGLRTNAALSYRKFTELSLAQDTEYIEIARKRLQELEGSSPNNLKNNTPDADARQRQENLRSLEDYKEAKQWLEKGYDLYNKDRFDEAIACYGKALEINPQKAGAWYNKAGAEYHLGLRRDAAVSYQKSIELAPTQDAEYIEHARKRLRELEGRFEEARQDYTEVSESNLHAANLWFIKGNDLYRSGRFDEAIEYYDSALEINPQKATVWNNKGSSLAGLGRDVEAIDCYDRALEINPENAEAWNNKGSSLHSLRSFSEAIECYNKALHINPQNADAWLNKGGTEYKLGMRREAAKSYRKYIELAPVQDAEYIEMARQRLRELEGRSTEAEEDHAQVSERDLQVANSWIAKGNSLYSLGRFDESIECYNKALEINPQHTEALALKGTILYGLHRYPEAINCYSKVLEINPQHTGSWFMKGRAEDELGVVRDATASYRKFIELASAQDVKQIEFARKRVQELGGS